MQIVDFNLINFNTDSTNHTVIPYLFKLAQELRVKSSFINSGENIYVKIEGQSNKIKSFVQKVQIKTVSGSEEGDRVLGFENTGPCPECLKEINNPDDRRYRYHLTSCNYCGPQLNYLSSPPATRENSSFSGFTPCPECENELNEPGRRNNYPFNSCPECGPELKLLDDEGEINPSKDVLLKAAYLINKGDLLAVRTGWGFKVIGRDKPENLERAFEISGSPPKYIFKSIKDIEKYFPLSKEERALLSADYCVLLKPSEYAKRFNLNDCNLAACRISPSPLHSLLLNQTESSYISEWGPSKTNEPPVVDERLAIAALINKVDYFLTYPMKQATAFEKAEVRAIHNGALFIRPEFERFYPGTSSPVIALGEEDNSSIAVSDEKGIYYAPAGGELNNFQTLRRYKETYLWLRSNAGITPKITAFSPRPNSKLSRFAEKLSNKTIRVQHHHAHAVSVMVENGINEQVLAVVFDSGGYSSGDKLAGGEFLLADRSGYQRVAFFEEFELPGAKICFDEPWRIGLSMLYQAFDGSFFPFPQMFKNVSQHELTAVKTMLDQKINCLTTNSLTLLMNGFAAMAGLSDRNIHKNQAFERLRSFDAKPAGVYHNRLKEFPEIKLSSLIKQVYADTFIKEPEEIASCIRQSVSDLTVRALLRLSKKYKIKKAVVTGDLFEDSILLDGLLKDLEGVGFECYTNRRLPLNDFNISLGQAAAAAAIFNGGHSAA